MARIFLSYARADAFEIAEKLHHRLLSLGHEVFWDIESIRAGKRWREELHRRVKWADLVVVLVTPGSNDSDFVFEEVSHAAEKGKPIIPVQVNDTPLPVHLRGVWHAIKFEDNNYDAVLLQIERSIKETPPPVNKLLWGIASILMILLGGAGLFILMDDSGTDNPGENIVQFTNLPALTEQSTSVAILHTATFTLPDQPDATVDTIEPSNTPSETPIVPTFTITPSRTPRPTITPTSTLEPGIELFYEDFQDMNADGFSNIHAASLFKVVTDELGNMVYEINMPQLTDGWPTTGFGSLFWQNYIIQYRFRYVTIYDSSKEGNISVGFRSDQSLNSFDVTLSLQQNRFYLNQWDAVSQRNRTIRSTQYIIEPNIWYNMQIELKDNQIKVFVNDDLIIDTRHDWRNVGHSYFSTGGNLKIQFDDIVVISN